MTGASKRKSKYKASDEKGFMLLPKTERQRDLIRAVCENEMVITTGCAGTGKSHVSISLAADMLNRGEVERIIVTRPNVDAGRSVGYLPGDFDEKIRPWIVPVLEILSQHMDKGSIDTAIKSGKIEFAILQHMRGRSFEDAFIILDEAQNTTVKEMKMFVTRIGQNCKCVINGDIMQHDLREQSGLAKIMHMAKAYNLPIPVIEFTANDIVRSDLVRQWILAFMEEGVE